jgi:hypothetical protein
MGRIVSARDTKSGIVNVPDPLIIALLADSPRPDRRFLSTASAPRRNSPARIPFWPRMARFGMVAAGLLLGVAGCMSALPPSGASAAPTTHLVIVNRSDCEWRIRLVPPGDAGVRTYHLPARATQAVDLVAGQCVIEQTMLTPNPGPEATRRFDMNLEAGQAYQWPLVTLLSAPAQPDASPGQPAAGAP